MTPSPDRFYRAQEEAYRTAHWPDGDRLPFRERCGQNLRTWIANSHLIRLEPLMRLQRGQTALTICDGLGVDASYLTHCGLRVTASDLAPVHLPELASSGRFDDWRQENAEALSLADGSFDWAVVKAGLHHLPRPWIGVYEMLRVARQGIVFSEAHDGWLLRTLRRWLRPGKDYESSGNYVFRFTRRETIKVARGSISLPWRRGSTFSPAIDGPRCLRLGPGPTGCCALP